MITIVFGSHFLKSVKKLPKVQQEKLAELLEKVRINPFSAQLHTKPLTGQLSGLYSFRITRNWRVFFQFLATEKIQLIEAKHRKDIYG